MGFAAVRSKEKKILVGIFDGKIGSANERIKINPESFGE
jgi:hypothetical protein